jgi:hypothetical protein
VIVGGPVYNEAAKLTGMGGHPVHTDWLASPSQEETQPFGVCWLAGDCPHQGIDVAAPEGTPIVSQVTGTMEELTDPRGFGNYQVIHTGNSNVLLGHEGSWLVPPGPVYPGEEIATEGSTGYSTGAHLHFGLQVGGQWVDPGDVLYRHGQPPQAQAPGGQGAAASGIPFLSGFLDALGVSLTDLFWRGGLIVAGLLIVLVGLSVAFRETGTRVGMAVATRGASEAV